MRIPAYCSMSYLEKITKESGIDFMDPGQFGAAKHHFDLLELITEGLTIRTDVSEDEIDKLGDNKIIHYLKKNGTIKSTPKQFKELGNDKHKFFFEDTDTVCVCLLGDFYQSQISSLEEITGFHILT